LDSGGIAFGRRAWDGTPMRESTELTLHPFQRIIP
jgi:hypothetical protein